MDKNKPDLPEMIDRYERGNTSLEEEQILFDYITDQYSANAPESLRAQFVYFKNKKHEPPSDVFETRLHKILETHAPRQLNVRLLLRIAAILLVGFGVGWLALSYAYRTEDTLSTGPAERTRVVLSDGTIVFINSSSELICDRNFDDHTRVVHLKGEAYFEVQRDTLRPFIIHTGDVSTEVLGTSFNLRYYEDEKFTEINVRSGQVRFGASQKVKISKGEGAIQPFHRKHIEVTAANANADAWKTGILTFENAKMKDVIRDIERYFLIKIETTNVSLLDCHFTGKFSKPGLEDVLKVIAYSLNIQYTVVQDKYFLSGQHCQQ